MARARGDIEARRQRVAELWLRGASFRHIAKTLQLSVSAVQRDVDVIRDELRRERISDLEACRARSVAVLRRVQEAAWLTFAHAPEKSLNRTGALNVVLAAEEKIAKLEGTLRPDALNQTTVNVLSLPEWQQTRAAVLAALAGYPDARLAVADALAQLEAPLNAPHP